MPSLIRLLMVVGLLGGVAYGAMLNAAREVCERKTFTFAQHTMAYAQFNEIFNRSLERGSPSAK